MPEFQDSKPQIPNSSGDPNVMHDNSPYDMSSIGIEQIAGDKRLYSGRNREPRFYIQSNNWRTVQLGRSANKCHQSKNCLNNRPSKTATTSNLNSWASAAIALTLTFPLLAHDGPEPHPTVAELEEVVAELKEEISDLERRI